MFLIQALLSRADLKVKELRQSMDRLKAESDKLEVSLFSYFKSLFLFNMRSAFVEKTSSVCT